MDHVGDSSVCCQIVNFYEWMLYVFFFLGEVKYTSSWVCCKMNGNMIKGKELMAFTFYCCFRIRWIPYLIFCKKWENCCTNLHWVPLMRGLGSRLTVPYCRSLMVPAVLVGDCANLSLSLFHSRTKVYFLLSLVWLCHLYLVAKIHRLVLKFQGEILIMLRHRQSLSLNSLYSRVQYIFVSRF